MPARTRTALGTIWKKVFTSSLVGFPKFISPYELTKSSWATQIKSYAEVPEVYKRFFEPLLANGSTFPYTIQTPSYENFIHKTTEKLICDFGFELYVLERKGDGFEAQCYPVKEISYIEMRTALLASSFKICGMTDQRNFASTTLKFNSITDYLFAPFLKRARCLSEAKNNCDYNAELEKFNCLADVNFKFMNLAKRSLLEGELLVQFILQPEMQQEVLTFLKKTFCRTIAATRMCILTDRELILIQEDARQRKEDRYGGIWTYIPLHKIVSLSTSENPDSMLALVIQLPDKTRFEFLFQSSAVPEIDQLINRFAELTAK